MRNFLFNKEKNWGLEKKAPANFRFLIFFFIKKNFIDNQKLSYTKDVRDKDKYSVVVVVVAPERGPFIFTLLGFTIWEWIFLFFSFSRFGSLLSGNGWWRLRSGEGAWGLTSSQPQGCGLCRAPRAYTGPGQAPYPLPGCRSKNLHGDVGDDGVGMWGEGKE